MFGSTEKKAETAPPITRYPGNEEVDFARKSGFYKDMYEPWTEGQVARVFKDDIRGKNIADLPDEKLSKMVSGNKDTAEVYAKGALVSNRIPIAALGFNPDRATLETTLKDVNIAGAYSPNKDRMFVIADYASTIVHESIHRGLEYIRRNSEEGKKILDKMREHTAEETIVRHLMATQAGNPESGRGELADEQIKAAQYAYSNSVLADKRNADLKRLTEIAQELQAKRYPSRGARQ